MCIAVVVLIFLATVLPQIKIKIANKTAENIVIGDFIGQNLLTENTIAKNENIKLNNNTDTEYNNKKTDNQIERKTE